MATPQPRIDETRGLSLVSRDGKTREQTRYLFTALDVIDPDRKYQISTVRDGGEEVAARCLRRTPNYIPRCELTPLETWFEPIGIPELAGDRMDDLVSLSVPAPEVLPQFNPTSFFRRNEPTMGMPHYPGVDLPLIIEVAGYRGVKEIEAMRGVEWESGEAQRIQEAIFPASWEKPVALRLIEDRIKEAAVGSLLPVGEEMLLSLDRSRRWALTRIGAEHGLLQTRIKHDHTYTYSRLAPQLLAQLEMEPKDVGNETSRFAKEIVQELLAAQKATAPVDINGIVEQAVKAALLARGISDEPKADFPCLQCNEKSFPTQAGLDAHQRQWCKAKSEPEQ
jgi:hypothetical protein